MRDFNHEWLSLVEKSLSAGPCLIKDGKEFDQACDHVVQLIQDSSALLEIGSIATSMFLSITAMEETAKIHLGMFRRSQGIVKRSKDPLFRHKDKHRIAASPTVVMGNRLPNAIGKKRLDKIIKLARYGGLVALREECLYLGRRGDRLHIPRTAANLAQARELLLFVIESFDDALVGFSNHSLVLGKVTDALFVKWQSLMTCPYNARSLK